MENLAIGRSDRITSTVPITIRRTARPLLALVVNSSLSSCALIILEPTFSTGRPGWYLRHRTVRALVMWMSRDELAAMSSGSDNHSVTTEEAA